MKTKLGKTAKRTRNRLRKKNNLQKIDDAKKYCAEWLGLPAEKYSNLELCVCVAAKLGSTINGKIHPNQQIKYWATRIKRDANQKPDTALKSLSKDFYSSRVWKVLRYQAFEEYGNCCACCGASPSDGVTMHIDHVKPKSTHPELALDLSNLQVLCEECNIGKINQWDTNWMDYHGG